MKIDFQYNVPGLIYALLIFVPIYIIIEFIFFYKKKKTKNIISLNGALIQSFLIEIYFINSGVRINFLYDKFKTKFDQLEQSKDRDKYRLLNLKNLRYLQKQWSSAGCLRYLYDYIRKNSWKNAVFKTKNLMIINFKIKMFASSFYA